MGVNIDIAEETTDILLDNELGAITVDGILTEEQLDLEKVFKFCIASASFCVDDMVLPLDDFDIKLLLI